MSQLPCEAGAERKAKKSLDFRSEKRNMRLLNATSVTLFNNLNQAICVGTHSIEHQKQFLIFNVW
ncbi:hypothetical protein K3H43_10655 [Aeromonas veronii]|uniref:hypothetical protein n=1 Tax=Aeromonas veronii TaxID=654 RepID=UPI001F2C5FB7|nr:hypothetical protein [Aeromonas veronii]MCF5727841.1 hypothetical protein [Aeromonas veronii]